MLRELRVRNLAVIDDVTLSMGPGLSALTGETGAGKSILVDALSLLLGERASQELIRPGTERAVVEARFELDDNPVPARAALDCGVELEHGELIVKREINAQGRNRAWANGSPTTISVLGALGAQLVDLHGQHETQSLLDRTRQLEILDQYAGITGLRSEVAACYHKLKEVAAREAELKRHIDGIHRKSDYLAHVVREISDADPQPGEDEQLAVEAKRLSNIGDLRQLSEQMAAIIDGEEGGLLDLAANLDRTLARLENLDPTVRSWREPIESVEAQLADLVREVRDYADNTELDPARLEEVQQRQDVIFRLKQKYGPTLDDVFRMLEESRRELDTLDSAGHDIAALSEEVEDRKRELDELARRLSELRAKAASELAERVNELLPGLGLARGEFSVRIEPLDQPGPRGIDRVTFEVRLNPGLPGGPLAKVASGGELSRVMLALRVILAGEDQRRTLVFDEVDQGIGGDVANRVGECLKQVAKHHQVLVVTHLTQIAARAATHFRVNKTAGHDTTSVSVTRLTQAERVGELARMLGDGADRAAQQHARELLSRV